MDPLGLLEQPKTAPSDPLGLLKPDADPLGLLGEASQPSLVDRALTFAKKVLAPGVQPPEAAAPAPDQAVMREAAAQGNAPVVNLNAPQTYVSGDRNAPGALPAAATAEGNVPPGFEQASPGMRAAGTAAADILVKPLARAPIETARGLAFLGMGIDPFGDASRDRLGAFVDKATETLSRLHPDKDAGFLAQFTGGLVGLAPYLVTGGVGAMALLTNSASRGIDAINQGVDPKTATALTVKDLATTGAFFMMPMGGETLPGGVAKGVMMNVGLDIASKAVEKGILTAADYDDLAKKVRIWDPESLAQATGMGAVFGVQGTLGRSPRERAADLYARAKARIAGDASPADKPFPIHTDQNIYRVRDEMRYPLEPAPAEKPFKISLDQNIYRVKDEERYPLPPAEPAPASAGEAPLSATEPGGPESRADVPRGTNVHPEQEGQKVTENVTPELPAGERRGQLGDDTLLREKLNALPTEAIHNMILTDPVSGARSRLAYELLERDSPAEFTGISDARGLGAVDKHLGHKAGDDFVQRVVEAHKEEGIPIYRASERGDEFLTRWNGLTKEEADAKLKAVNDRLRNSDLIVENPDGSKRYFTNLELYTALGRNYNEAGQLLGEQKRTNQPEGYVKGEFPRHLVELTEEQWLAKTRGEGNPAPGSARPAPSETVPEEVAPQAEQPSAATNQGKEALPTELHAFPGPLFRQAGRLVGKLFNKSIEGLKRGFAPASLSPEHLQAANTLRQVIGESNRMAEQRAFRLEFPQRAFDKLGVTNKDIPLEDNVGIKTMSALSTGKPLPSELANNKAVQEYVGARERIYDDLIKQIQTIDPNALKTIRENYMPGMWTADSRRAFNMAMDEASQQGLIGEGFNVNEATPELKRWVRDRTKQLIAEGKGSEPDTGIAYLSKRTLEGKGSFRRHKSFEDIMTGVEFGLEPVSNNPVTLDRLKMAEMQRYLDGNKALQKYKAEGTVKFWSVLKGKPPEGWRIVNDPLMAVYGPRQFETKALATEKPLPGFPLIGHWIAKAPTADILENYLSQSLYNSKIWGPLFKGYMASANELNQFQLTGFFHAGFTTADSIISANANLVKSVFNLLGGHAKAGDLKKDVLDIKDTLELKTPAMGGEILRSWLDPTHPASERTKNVVRAIELVGGGSRMEDIFRNQDIDKAIADWYGGNKVKGAARGAVFGTGELLSKPVLEMLVPRQKFGVFSLFVDRIMRDNPGKPIEALAPQLNEAWNRIDARLGQVRYDRLFMDKTVKNLVQGTFRAPGWTGGTIAELGGALKDTGTFFRQWQQTGKLPPMTDRQAYAISLAVTTAVINSALQYAMVSIHNMNNPNDKQDPYPESWKDFVAFRTGGADAQGRKNRFWLPTYAKDVYSWATHPAKTIVNKVNPVLSAGAQLYQNKDYYGNQIYDEQKPAYDPDNLQNLAKYLGEQFVPFTIRAMKEQARGTEPLYERAAPVIGITPAPKYLMQSKAENMASDYVRANMPAGGKTLEQQISAKAKQDIRIGQPGEEDRAAAAFEKGDITKRQFKEILRDAGKKPLEKMFKHLTMEQAKRVYAVATPEEKELLETAMTRKLSNARKNRPFKVEDQIDEETRDQLKRFMVEGNMSDLEGLAQ